MLAAFGTLLSGVGSLMSGAASMMSMFRKQKGDMITGSGQGKGFWKFYSCTTISQTPVSKERIHEYADMMFDHIVTDQAINQELKHSDFYLSLHVHLKWREYGSGRCFNSISTFKYDKNIGALSFYIYTLDPIINMVWDEKKYVIMVNSMKIVVNFEMVKDWMIITHMKTNFLKGYINDEFKYLDEKAIRMDDVVNAIGIAMAPAYLGLVQVPPQFVKAMQLAFEKQVDEQPKAPNPELKAGATQLFGTLVQTQQQMNQQAQDGLQKLADGFQHPKEDPTEKSKKEQDEKDKQAQQAQAQNSFDIWDHPRPRPRRPLITKKQY